MAYFTDFQTRYKLKVVPRLANEALTRIGELYVIEAELRGHSAELRQQVRQARAGPKLWDS